MDRNCADPDNPNDRSKVALLAEGVDRNSAMCSPKSVFRRSPSSRRAWIEIIRFCSAISPSGVALLAEGVDRNHTGIPTPVSMGESPSSRRAWIEIP